MNHVTFDNYSQALIERANYVWKEKVGSYTNEAPDPLANFKRIGEFLGLPASTVASVYFLKHVASILTIARGGPDGGEPLMDRCADAVNYLKVLVALAEEEKPPHHAEVNDA